MLFFLKKKRTWSTYKSCDFLPIFLIWLKLSSLEKRLFWNANFHSKQKPNWKALPQMLPESITSNPVFLRQRTQKRMWKTCRDQMLALCAFHAHFWAEFSHWIWSSLTGQSRWPGIRYLCIRGWGYRCCLPLGHIFVQLLGIQTSALILA